MNGTDQEIIDKARRAGLDLIAVDSAYYRLGGDPDDSRSCDILTAVEYALAWLADCGLWPIQDRSIDS